MPPPRKIPASLREKIKEELHNMEKTGVIRKIHEPAEWVNSMVVVKRIKWRTENLFESRALNKTIKREYYQLPTFEEIARKLSEAKLFRKLDANKGYWQKPLDKESIRLTTFKTCQRLLELLNFVGKFIPNLSQLSARLRERCW